MTRGAATEPNPLLIAGCWASKFHAGAWMIPWPAAVAKGAIIGCGTGAESTSGNSFQFSNRSLGSRFLEIHRRYCRSAAAPRTPR